MVLSGRSDDRGRSKKPLAVLIPDAGLNIGHSVRTIPEALAAGGRTLDVWISQLEARFVCGDQGLAGGFAAAMARA
jgi:UTP:GlnB (protein PII) uridylyltransferase